MENEQFAWSAESIASHRNLLQSGKDLLPYDPPPFYKGNPRQRMDGIVYLTTEEEAQEIIKVKESFDYFVNSYVFVETDHGMERMTIRPFERRLIKEFSHYQYNAVLHPRHCGMTTFMGIYVLWLSIKTEVHADSIVVASPQLESSRFIMEQIMKSYDALPYFLQPGIQSIGRNTIQFGNVNIKFVPLHHSKPEVVGMGIKTIIILDAAHIGGFHWENFWPNVWPLMKARTDTSVIVASSSASYQNHFYGLWEASITERNEFRPVRIDWWDIPEWDVNWFQRTSKKMGMKDFATSYLNSFNAKEYTGT